MPRSTKSKSQESETTSDAAPERFYPSRAFYLPAKGMAMHFPTFVQKFPPSAWNPRTKDWLAEIDSLYALIPVEFFGDILEWETDRQEKIVELAKQGQIADSLTYISEGLKDGSSDYLITGLAARESDFVLPLLRSLLEFSYLRYIGADPVKDSESLAKAANSKEDLPSQMEAIVRFFEDCRGDIQVVYTASVNLAPYGSGREKVLVVAEKEGDLPAEILDGNTRVRLLLKVIELLQERNPVDIDVLVNVEPVSFRAIGNLTMLDRFAVVASENGSNPLGRMAQFLVLADLYKKTPASFTLKEFLKSLKNSGVKIDGREFTAQHKSILKRWIELPDEFKEFAQYLTSKDINAPLNLYATTTAQLAEILKPVDPERFQKNFDQHPDLFCKYWCREVNLRGILIEMGLPYENGGFTVHDVPELSRVYVSVLINLLLKTAPDLFPEELEKVNSELKFQQPIESEGEVSTEISEEPAWHFEDEDPADLDQRKKGLTPDGKVVSQHLVKGVIPTFDAPLPDIGLLLADIQEITYHIGMTPANSIKLAPTIASIVKAQQTLAQSAEVLAEYLKAAELVKQADELPELTENIPEEGVAAPELAEPEFEVPF